MNDEWYANYQIRQNMATKQQSKGWNKTASNKEMYASNIKIHQWQGSSSAKNVFKKLVQTYKADHPKPISPLYVIPFNGSSDEPV